MKTSLRDLEFSDFAYRKLHRWAPPDPMGKPVRGLDTETYEGKPMLVADSEGRTKRIGFWENLRDFLLYRGYRDSVNGFWNLDFDFRGLQKLLHPEQMKSLYYLGKVQIGDVRVEWIPKKYFALKKDKHTCEFYDFQQFYHTSLDKASREFLGTKKVELDVKRLKDPEFWRNNWDRIERYCVRDAKLTGELGELIRDEIEEIGVSFHRPYSAGFLAGEYLQRNSYVPKFRYSPEVRYAMKSYYGGRFEVFERGYFPHVYLYDINSAFPYQMSRLPDFSDGEWEKVQDYRNSHQWGFGKIQLTDSRSKIATSPLDRNSLMVFPNSERREIFTTLPELEFLKDIPGVRAEFIDGWVFHPSSDSRPFSFLRELYQKKERVKGESKALYLAYKVILNACYGKTVETRRKLRKVEEPSGPDFVELLTPEEEGIYELVREPGSLLFPPIGALMTGMARVQLLRKMLEYRDSVLACFTDCIISSRKLPIESGGFGGWSLDSSGEGLIVGSGVYSIRDGDSVKDRTRGFNLTQYENLWEAVASNRRDPTIEVILENPVTTGEVFRYHKKYSIDQLNQFTQKKRTIDVNFDRKRRWNRTMDSFGDLRENRVLSKPLTF